MLVFKDLILWGDVNEIAVNPPTIVIEIFDKDIGVSRTLILAKTERLRDCKVAGEGFGILGSFTPIESRFLLLPRNSSVSRAGVIL